MKRISLFAAILFLAAPSFSADLTIKSTRPDNSAVEANTNYRDRGDSTTYAPTVNCEAIYSYEQGNSSEAVKVSAGLFHTLIISSAVAAGVGAGLAVYDSTHTGDTSRPIAKFEVGADLATLGTHTFDVISTSGIVVLSPASGPEWTITYR